MSVTVRNDQAGPAEADGQGLSPAQGAAVVLALLDEQGLGVLSGRLSVENKARFARALEGLADIDPAQQQRVAKAFAQAFARRRTGVYGGAEAASRLSGRIYGVEAPGEDAAEEVAAPPQTFWERVEALGAKPLAEFLDGVPTPAAAIALGQLPEPFAADVAAAMNEPSATGGLVRLARAEGVNEVALAAVEAMIEAAFFGEAPSSKPVDTAKADQIAGLLNRLPTARREKALAALQAETDAELFAAIKERVLGFDDLAGRLPRNVVPVVFREVDEARLLLALSYAGGRGSPTATYLFGNISQRLAEQLKERLPQGVAEEDGEKAQAEIVGFVLGLVKDGRTELLDPSED